MIDKFVLITNPEGEIMIGIPSSIGLIPVMNFSSLEELRRFAMGILGYCEYFSPKVPDVFLKAFTKEDTND